MDDPPTFLACGLYRPHLPWRVPQKWFDLFPLDTIQLPDVRTDDRDDIPASVIKRLSFDKDHKKILAKGQWKAGVQAYLAASAFADAMVGRLLAALAESAAAKDTIVMLWSDHGWHLGASPSSRHGCPTKASAGPPPQVILEDATRLRSFHRLRRRRQRGRRRSAGLR